MIDTTAPTAVLFGLTYILRTKRYALVMEYSPLGTMEQQPLATTWKDVMEQAFRISANLDKMHRAGVVHGDLHPANIVFSSQRPMIVGVGLSRAVTDRRAVAYRPPEAVEGADGTKAADVYCLGTLLWQMVTGVPPRRETKCGDSIPGAAPEYNDIIQRCWDKDPSARPSAEDVAGFTSFWLYRCKHKDDESPFLPETRAFVAERRAVHLEQSEADGFGSLTSRL
ncbi:kinase-like domain-containing protein [Jimgerdemannia flammicorona]|uniref:Kinase-like domain-containing protein n=1 Tax=Jimgerdemannia flammicorona TaxID=994334 RepID=A0A433DEG6_9FUNG|nr:kinase-like domain-containing protein [Jimgerdemannia flammicorona]